MYTVCMKIKTLFILLISSILSVNSFASHPRDFISDGALAVLSIQNGDSINTIAKAVSSQVGFSSKEPLLANYLSLFIQNPTGIDFSEEILLVVEPTKVQDGQSPTGMFGPIPHLVFVCKPKDGTNLKINKTYLKNSTLYDGWFIATAGDSSSEIETYRNSPILKLLKKDQLSMAIKFGDIWKQFGPIAQMTGGVMIGTLNKPGKDGLISQETKKFVSEISKAFGALMKFCGNINVVTIGSGLQDFKLVTNVDIELITKEDVFINNRSMLQMSSLLADNMIQYAMSSDLTRKLLEYDLTSIQTATNVELPVTPITQGLKLISDLSGHNVVSYNLSKQNGLSIAALTEVENQSDYLDAIPTFMDELTEYLLSEMNMSIVPSQTNKHTWDVSMIGSDSEDQKIMDAVFPKGDTLRFKKFGKDKISIALGPKNWKSVSQKRATPLALVIKENKDIAIDFAMTIDARDLLCGFVDVSKSAGQADDISNIRTTPSAKLSFVFGRDNDGYSAQNKLDLMGIAMVQRDIEAARQEAKANANSRISSGGIVGTKSKN